MNTNTPSPDSDGEYELTYKLRYQHSFCASHEIVDVECRPIDGRSGAGQVDVAVDVDGPSLPCSKEGYRCRSHGAMVCADHEIRFRCQCRCRDGLGMEDGAIGDAQLSASAAPTGDQASASPAQAARLNGDDAWSPSAPVQDLGDWLQVDLLAIKEVTGVLVQGHPQRDHWVTAFSVQHSVDGKWWHSIMHPAVSDPFVFAGNEDGDTVKRVMFPDSLLTRYVRIIPIEFHGAISLRLELLGCDVAAEQTTVESRRIETTTTTTAAPIRKAAGRCDVSGWTPWMNAHVPGPGDWSDSETFNALRVYHEFCDDAMVTQIRCRVTGTHVPFDLAGQRGLTCDLNNGLLCNGQLQNNLKCWDYEVQLYCTCPEEATTPSGAAATTPAPATPQVSTTTAPAVCPPGSTWTSCAYRCDQVRTIDRN